MTDKITLSIYIVGISKLCDFSVPSNMCVRDATALIKKIVSDEFLGNKDNIEKKLYLIRSIDAKVLNESMSLAQLGISNGERLILA